MLVRLPQPLPPSIYNPYSPYLMGAARYGPTLEEWDALVRVEGQPGDLCVGVAGPAASDGLPPLNVVAAQGGGHSVAALRESAPHWVRKQGLEGMMNYEV